MLVGGAPLGVVAAPAAGGTQTVGSQAVGSQAAGGLANLTLELRHNGQPVNPLEQMRLP